MTFKQYLKDEAPYATDNISHLAALVSGTAAGATTTMGAIYGLLYKLPEIAKLNQHMTDSPIISAAIDFATEHPTPMGLGAVALSGLAGIAAGWYAGAKTNKAVSKKLKKIMEFPDVKKQPEQIIEQGDDFHEVALKYGRTSEELFPTLPQDKYFAVGYNKKFGLIDVHEDDGRPVFEGRINIEDFLASQPYKSGENLDTQVLSHIMKANDNYWAAKNNQEVDPNEPILEIVTKYEYGRTTS